MWRFIMDARVEPAHDVERSVAMSRKPGNTEKHTAELRTMYKNGEIGTVKVIEDFLPSPEALVARKDAAKDRRRRVGKAKRAHRSTI